VLVQSQSGLANLVYFISFAAASLIIVLWMHRYGGTGSRLDPKRIVKEHKSALLCLSLILVTVYNLELFLGYGVSPEVDECRVGNTIRINVSVRNPFPMPIRYSGYNAITVSSDRVAGSEGLAEDAAEPVSMSTYWTGSTWLMPLETRRITTRSIEFDEEGVYRVTVTVADRSGVKKASTMVTAESLEGQR
jgi:hypothetical protein